MVKVWTVLYHHRHGVDSFVCGTPERAQRCAEESVQDTRRDSRYSIDPGLSDQEVVANLYELTHGDESVDIDETEVLM
jgi:hypothetical protein